MPNEGLNIDVLFQSVKIGKWQAKRCVAKFLKTSIEKF